MDHVSPAICLDILNIAAQNKSADIREIADQNEIAPCLIFELLSGLMLAGVLTCSVAPDPNLLKLCFGPKAVQAVYLFALNCQFTHKTEPSVASKTEPVLRSRKPGERALFN